MVAIREIICGVKKPAKSDSHRGGSAIRVPDRKSSIAAEFVAFTLFVTTGLLGPVGHTAQGLPLPGPLSPSIFESATDRVTLDFQHDNGATGQFYLPEITGSGAALLDVDNDGDLDIFLVQGGALSVPKTPGRETPVGRLYLNALVESSTLAFTDVTEKSGIGANGYGMGVAAGDINNDGWVDLYVTTLQSNVMFLNHGDGTFSDVTGKTGTADSRWSMSAAFFDYDRDGWLDLFVANYVDFPVSNYPTCYATNSAKDYCGLKAFRSMPDRLFRNKGDGTFEDASTASGILREYGAGLGVVTDDFTGDGWADVYVANDADPNQLWVNQRDGTFQNRALLGGAAVNRDGQAEAGMGVDSGDFNGDGHPDIFLTHLMEETNTLYVNLGGALFEDRTIEAGLGRRTRRYTGFGTLWFDYDNDGWLDLLSANGSVRTLVGGSPQREGPRLGQPNQLFRNLGRGTFEDVSSAAGESFQRLDVSRGVAFGDVDNDGDTDVLVSNNNGRPQLLLNTVGNQRAWLGLRLVGASVSRDMLGAQVDVIVTNNQLLRRRVRTDGGYLSAHDPRVLVGLGRSERVEAVRIHWPSGEIEERQNPQTRQYLTLRQGGSNDRLEQP